MQRYITFVRNNKTREEFIITARAYAGAHAHVMRHQMQKYPQPYYTVHTTYTEIELKNILETLNRWAGPGISHGSKTALKALPYAG